jgi:hypothetical protein
MDAFRRFYGSHPLHLLALLGCFALIGAVLTFVVPDPSAWWLLVWFLGAVIAHDLVLYPLYALADRPLVLGRWLRRRVSDEPIRVPAINHLRIPVMGSALLGLLFLPSIARTGEPVLLFAAGRSTEQYGRTWLLVTALLFLGSAVVYAIRLGRAAVAERRASAPEAPEAPESEDSQSSPPVST